MANDAAPSRNLAADYGFIAVLCTLFILFNLALVAVSSTTVHFEVTPLTEGDFQVFWKTSDRQYSEIDSIKVELVTGRQQLKMSIPSPLFLRSLRIDFIDSKSSVQLHTLDLQHPLFALISPLQSHDSIISRHQVASIQEGVDQGWQLTADGDDPHLEVKIRHQPLLAIISAWLGIALIGGILFSLLLNEKWLKGPLSGAILVVNAPDALSSQQINELITAITSSQLSGKLHSLTQQEASTIYRFSLSLNHSAEVLSLLKHLHGQHLKVGYQLQFARAGMIHPVPHGWFGLGKPLQ